MTREKGNFLSPSSVPLDEDPMSAENDPLDRALQALRVPPPEGDFETRLLAALEAAPAPDVQVGPAAELPPGPARVLRLRPRARVVVTTLTPLLVAAGVLIAVAQPWRGASTLPIAREEVLPAVQLPSSGEPARAGKDGELHQERPAVSEQSLEARRLKRESVKPAEQSRLPQDSPRPLVPRPGESRLGEPFPAPERLDLQRTAPAERSPEGAVPRLSLPDHGGASPPPPAIRRLQLDPEGARSSSSASDTDAPARPEIPRLDGRGAASSAHQGPPPPRRELLRERQDGPAEGMRPPPRAPDRRPQPPAGRR